METSHSLKSHPTDLRMRIEPTSPDLNLFILMDYPIHIGTIRMKLSILYFKGSHDVSLSLKMVFILASSADPHEMLHYAAFHLGLHCLPMNLLTGIQNEKDESVWVLSVNSIPTSHKNVDCFFIC